MRVENVEDPILITGGSGFLGQHLANDLVRHGYHVVLFDIKEDRCLLGTHVNKKNCAFISGDILNLSELIDSIIKHKARSIIHGAAIIPPASDLRPYQSIQVNIIGTCHVFEAARLLKLGRVTFMSSGAVYDPKGGTCIEDSPIPLDPPFGLYGCEKASCELIGLKYAHMYGLDFVSTRNAVIYGPGATSQHYMNILVSNAVQGKKTELRSGGDHRFEFIYVKDTVQGIRRVHTAIQLEYRIYNIGTGQTHSLFELAEKIKKYIPTADISLGPGLLDDVAQRSPFNIGRAKDLGYLPEYDLDRGLNEFIQAFR